ncbi:hypothetical protein [Inquilinus sp. OTU3971]|uniref:hypothetical protein n=1 Tax=Inquilinus sp. OTU3971 TaxID=3043855 RepID=UPI00313E28E4
MATLALLTLAGCTTWVRPGATPEQADAALTLCRARSIGQLPPDMVTVMTSEGHYTDTKEKCKERHGNFSCKTTGGTYVQPNYETRDQNDAPRETLIDACMIKGGWTKKSDF